MTFLVSPAAAQVPGDACATAQQYKINGGPETSGIVHMMVCQGGTWKAIVSANANGEVTKIGNQTCANGDFVKYDGTKFVCTTGTCADTTPDAFNFTNLANQAVSTQVTSNILQISGFGCAINTVITGSGSPEYRICSTSNCSSVVQDWTSGGSSITSGQYLQLRVTTSASGGDTRQATVIAGNTASVWSAATTGDCTDPSPPIGTVCADGTVYAGLSPDGNVKMFVTRCDAGMTWNGTTCTGTRWTLTWNNGTSNWTVTGATNVSTGEANTNTLAASSDAGADYAAAEHCYGLDDGNGNTDWYLPARNELAVMEAGKSAIGQFALTAGTYWSSSETANNNAWYQRFNDSYQSIGGKNVSYAIRCARR